MVLFCRKHLFNTYTCITYINVTLTNCIACGGWVPGTSKGFHYWQPAPRPNNAPMAGTAPHPAMRPHAKENKTGTRHTEEYVEKKQRGGGRARWRMLSANNAGWKLLTLSKHTPHERQATLLSMRAQTNLWPLVPLALFVVNSFKLHLNALCI